MWLVSGGKKAGMEAEKKEGRLSVDETKLAIQERLARFSPATPASVLPWKCTPHDDGRVALSFEVCRQPGCLLARVKIRANTICHEYNTG